MAPQDHSAERVREMAAHSTELLDPRRDRLAAELEAREEQATPSEALAPMAS